MASDYVSDGENNERVKEEDSWEKSSVESEESGEYDSSIDHISAELIDGSLGTEQKVTEPVSGKPMVIKP
jgi:hypothetical protein